MELAIIFIAAVIVYNTWQLSKLIDYNANTETININFESNPQHIKKKRGRPRKSKIE